MNAYYPPDLLNKLEVSSPDLSAYWEFLKTSWVPSLSYSIRANGPILRSDNRRLQRRLILSPGPDDVAVDVMF